MYKTLLQGGHFNKKTQNVDTTENWDALHFASLFINTVSQNVVTAMCTEGERNGSFIIATLCETLMMGGDDKKSERQVLKSWFGEKEREKIEKGDGRGKHLLLEKLSLL
jgi:pumilio family protein 6